MADPTGNANTSEFGGAPAFDESARLVDVAYRALLGREPDEEGRQAYEAALRAGMPASEFLSDLGASEEHAIFRQSADIADVGRAARGNESETLVDIAFRALLGREPDEEGRRAYEEALRAGMPASEFLSDLEASEEHAELRSRIHRALDQIQLMASDNTVQEEVELLVRLAFRATLRREPDGGALEVYGEELRTGKKFSDIISDIMKSEEFASIDQSPRSISGILPMIDTEADTVGRRLDDYAYPLVLLEARLHDKGCLLQLGPISFGHLDHNTLAPLLRSLTRTLSVLEHL